jgi:hypothetical protein
MSTITSPSTATAPFSTSAPSNPAANQHGPTPERINTLLKAGPNWSVPPRAPSLASQTTSGTVPSAQEAEATKKLDDLNATLTPDTIKEIQSNPSSAKSRTISDAFDKTLTPENVRLMSRGNNAKKNRGVLREIRDKLDKKKLDSNLGSAKHQMSSDLTSKMLIKVMEAIMTAFDGDLWDLVEKQKDSYKGLEEMRKNFSEMQTRSEKMKNTAASLSDEKLDQPVEPETRNSSRTNPSAQVPATYSFNATSESTLEAPTEVRHFKSEDKLDLSGIQKQLNTPLRQVGRTPEAKGEMQIHHSPSANTSVIVIADAPGKPPFVLKVFGEVRQSNIVT